MMKNIFTLVLTSIVVNLTFAQTNGLDPTFGSGGIVISDFASETYFQGSVNSLALQVDQKIIAAGSIYNGVYSSIVCRYNTDGSLDNSFGIAGKNIITDGSQRICHSMVLKNNGQILLGGGSDQFSIVAYDTNGDLDVTFNNMGVSSVSFGVVDSFPESCITNLFVLPDNKILAAGYVVKRYPNAISDSMYFAIAQFLPNGNLDLSFGDNGRVIIYESGSSEELDIVFKTARRISVDTQSDGKIIVSGTSSKLINNGGQNYAPLIFTCARLTSNGILDLTFGVNGLVKTFVKSSPAYPESDVINNSPCLKVLSGDHILVGGFAVTNTSRDFALVKYLPNGQLDNSFGTNGIAITNPSLSTTLYANDEAHALYVLDDGRILLAGHGWQTTSSATYQAAILIMYDSNGLLDPSFDNDGIKGLSLANYSTDIEAMALQNDGSFLIAGNSREDGSYPRKSTLARLMEGETSSLDNINLTSESNFVFPNPNNGEFNIQFNSTSNGKIEIYDVLGKKYFENEFSYWNGLKSIKLKTVPNGVYMIKITSMNTQNLQKIIIQN